MVRACSDYHEDLSALLDKELAIELESGTKAHLTECKDCASRFESLKKVSAFIGREAAGFETPDIASAVMAALPSVCDVIDEDLSAYLDGELPPQAQEGVNKHLDECVTCLDKFKRLNATNQLLSKGLTVPDSQVEDIWSKVSSRLTADCDAVNADLSAYLDLEIDTVRHREITAHLIDCLPCRGSFDSLTTVGTVLKEHYQPKIPDNLDLWPGIKSKMQVVPFTPRQAKSKKKARPRFAVMIGAAAAVIGLLGSLTYWLSLPDDAQLPVITPETYLIESSFEEPMDMAEALIYE